MLYLVGLGLADETDITVKGLEAVKKAERVYLEAYTSILLVEKEKLVCADSCLLIVACLAGFRRRSGANICWFISRKLSMDALLL